MLYYYILSYIINILLYFIDSFEILIAKKKNAYKLAPQKHKTHKIHKKNYGLIPTQNQKFKKHNEIYKSKCNKYILFY